jgi:hypothetical protein
MTDDRIDIDKISNCLTLSFYEYPVFTYLFPDIGSREKKLKEAMLFLINLGMKYPAAS